MLSLKRPRPSMLMVTPWTRSTSMKSSPVNWLSLIGVEYVRPALAQRFL
jgi:hypothetical protein